MYLCVYIYICVCPCVDVCVCVRPYMYLCFCRWDIVSLRWVGLCVCVLVDESFLQLLTRLFASVMHRAPAVDH